MYIATSRSRREFWTARPVESMEYMTTATPGHQKGRCPPSLAGTATLACRFIPSSRTQCGGIRAPGSTQPLRDRAARRGLPGGANCHSERHAETTRVRGSRCNQSAAGTAQAIQTTSISSPTVLGCVDRAGTLWFPSSPFFHPHPHAREAALKGDLDPDRLSIFHSVRVVCRKLSSFAAIPSLSSGGSDESLLEEILEERVVSSR